MHTKVRQQWRTLKALSICGGRTVCPAISRRTSCLAPIVVCWSDCLASWKLTLGLGGRSPPTSASSTHRAISASPAKIKSQRCCHKNSLELQSIRLCALNRKCFRGRSGLNIANCEGYFRALKGLMGPAQADQRIGGAPRSLIARPPEQESVMPTRIGREAVVIGAGMGGLMAASALSAHFDHVTILERDTLPERPEARMGTPQARHPHVLLLSGQQVLEQMFPGVLAQLEAAGAQKARLGRDIWWERPGFDPFPRRDLGYDNFFMSRPLLEFVCRSRVEGTQKRFLALTKPRRGDRSRRQ